MLYNFSQFSPSMVETKTLFLTISLIFLLFGCDEIGCSNSSQVSLFLGEGCDFLQKWVVDANKWVTFIKLIVTLIFNFLSGVCKSQPISSPWKVLHNFLCMPWNVLFNFPCIWICMFTWMWTNLNYGGISNKSPLFDIIGVHHYTSTLTIVFNLLGCIALVIILDQLKSVWIFSNFSFF